LDLLLAQEGSVRSESQQVHPFHEHFTRMSPIILSTDWASIVIVLHQCRLNFHQVIFCPFETLRLVNDELRQCWARQESVFYVFPEVYMTYTSETKVRYNAMHISVQGVPTFGVHRINQVAQRRCLFDQFEQTKGVILVDPSSQRLIGYVALHQVLAFVRMLSTVRCPDILVKVLISEAAAGIQLQDLFADVLDFASHLLLVALGSSPVLAIVRPTDFTHEFTPFGLNHCMSSMT